MKVKKMLSPDYKIASAFGHFHLAIIMAS